jgi:tol-pal system protein YbgF
MKFETLIVAWCGLALSGVAWSADLSTAQRLDLLERRVGHITELTLQLDRLRQENRTLRGETERLGYEIEQLKRKQRDLYLDIDQRLGATAAASGPSVDESVAASTAVSVDAGDGSAMQKTARSGTGMDRTKIETEYQAAYGLLSPEKRQYAEAASAFAAFLDKYPNDALSPNAQYWLGEAYYVSQKNAEALQAFEVVMARYPSSSKAPAALFKIGRLQQAAGNKEAARSSFQKVVTDYPNSSAAGLARQRLGASGR